MIARVRVYPDLPVFHLAYGARHVFYTPGHLAVVTAAEARGKIANELREHAQCALAAWKRKCEASFAPECLTIYLSNLCNLGCPYCFAGTPDRTESSGLRRRERIGRIPRKAGNTACPTWQPNHLAVGGAGGFACQPIHSHLLIDEKAALAAARLVARCCAEKQKPFHLVLHGGGEPAIHWELAGRLVEGTRRVAGETGVSWYGFIATNGVLAQERARWLARNFDQVELSCDGPPDIQDRQRPLAGGGPSSPHVERTAHALRDEGGRFSVRTTITPQTVERQTEIVAYLLERLHAREMRFEPLYRVRRPEEAAFQPEQAEWFVEHFLAAQKEARARGCDVSFSGARLDELHGPYCDVLRDTLHLLPDGSATACFFATGASFKIGRWDEAEGEFLLDPEQIAAHRRKTAQIPERCQDCLNAYHCARECPEGCAATARSGPGGFRCLVQRRLAEAWILEAAGIQRPPSSPGVLMELLRDAPSSLDKDAIRRQWEAAHRRFPIDKRSLPLPVWAERGFEQDGAQAWQQLSRDFPGAGDRAISIYVHVPFCDRRCGFCDCYSLPLGRRDRKREQEYARALLAEIEAWGGIEALARRPVTTVHFGGGTPNHLSPAAFRSVLEGIRAHFRVMPATEWALESTTSLLSEAHLGQLRGWGFTRLHAGIQTLEKEVRRLIGRREPAEVALAKLACALEMGFLVTVDVVFGLPRQTLAGLLETLESLVALGVHGFSLYGLNVSSRNRRFLERYRDPARSPLFDYALFQAGDQCLVRNGFRKNHFTHFARAEDRNLYYTHLQRGEDLLALGPTADGVFGAYHYRHPEYQEYVVGAAAGWPRLEGGVWESELERKLQPATVALMGRGIPSRLLRELNAAPLLEEWQEYALLTDGLEGGRYSLTANGSWFLTEMLRELAEAVRAA
jgi:radical SAM protein with 4Fe4S-binding SPASM domain